MHQKHPLCFLNATQMTTFVHPRLIDSFAFLACICTQQTRVSALTLRDFSLSRASGQWLQQGMVRQHSAMETLASDQSQRVTVPECPTRLTGDRKHVFVTPAPQVEEPHCTVSLGLFPAIGHQQHGYFSRHDRALFCCSSSAAGEFQNIELVTSIHSLALYCKLVQYSSEFIDNICLHFTIIKACGLICIGFK